jgi:glycosyltransferase involved in cell wall biosynthesis
MTAGGATGEPSRRSGAGLSGPIPRIASLLWRVLRGEGIRAVVDRTADRFAEARRRRSFRPAAEPPPGFACAVLNVAAAAPSPRLGGVQAQLLWRLGEEAKVRPVALLYPEEMSRGGGFRLELQRGGERRALRYLAPPAATTAPTVPEEARSSTALTSSRFESAVLWAAACCGADLVHVEGLAGMPLASLRRLRRGGHRLLLALHDFAAFCPRPHLLEIPPSPATPQFCHYSRDPARCAACLGADDPGLPPTYQEERREVARQLLEEADAAVYPSAFLARRHAGLFGAAGAAKSTVIAPALPDAKPMPSGAPRAARAARVPPGDHRRLHVAWVGAVQSHKGALVFETAVRALAAGPRPPRLTAYGGGDAAILRRWRRLPGLRVRGYYRAGSLPALLRRDEIDLVLLLSIVPESYGLALDECVAASVPVLAFAFGALGERLAPGSGILLDAALATDPAAAAGVLAATLRDLQEGRLPLPAPPAAPSLPLRAAAATQAWLALYGDLGLTFPSLSA